MTKNHETFEDVKADVFTRVKDAIEDEKNELQEKIKAYYLEHNDTNSPNMFEDCYYETDLFFLETENYIAEDLSMYYSDAWNIVNLARFAWTEEERQYYWDAVELVEPDCRLFKPACRSRWLDGFITNLSHNIIDALVRDEVTKQLEPFVSKVIESLETETHNA